MSGLDTYGVACAIIILIMFIIDLIFGDWGGPDDDFFDPPPYCR